MKHTLACVGPIGVFVIDYFKFGRTINRKQFTGIMVGVVGIVFAVNGQLITSYIDPSYEFHSEFANYKTDSVFVQFLVSICLILVNCGWSYAACTTKIINCNGVQINFHLGLMLVILSAVTYPLS